MMVANFSLAVVLGIGGACPGSRMINIILNIKLAKLCRNVPHVPSFSSNKGSPSPLSSESSDEPSRMKTKPKLNAIMRTT